VPGGIFLVMCVPFLERIESLLGLVEHLAGRGHRVTVVAPVDERFPRPSFSTPGIIHGPVATSRGGSEAPGV
jgi:hypothetical protein